MELIDTPLPGMAVIRPQRFDDARGYFMETYNRRDLEPLIGSVDFVQDNESSSTCGVLRGLHLQAGDAAQAKLVRVSHGSVYDVAVDLRPGSATFGKWYGIELSHENRLMLFLPRGFAHGFVVLSPTARFIYKVDNTYAPASEVTIAYNDPDIAVNWPVTPNGYLLSDKDTTRAISLRRYIETLQQ